MHHTTISPVAIELFLAMAGLTGCASVVMPVGGPPEPVVVDSPSTPSASDAGADTNVAMLPQTTPPSGGDTTPTPDPGTVTTLACQDITAHVNQPITLHAEAPRFAAFAWWIENGPPDSLAEIVLPDTPSPRFTPDQPGDWVIGVRTHDGQRGLLECLLRVHAE